MCAHAVWPVEHILIVAVRTDSFIYQFSLFAAGAHLYVYQPGDLKYGRKFVQYDTVLRLLLTRPALSLLYEISGLARSGIAKICKLVCSERLRTAICAHRGIERVVHAERAQSHAKSPGRKLARGIQH